MKPLRLFAAACASALLTAAPAHATVNLLLNGGFENSNSTAFADGTNIGVTVPGWTLASGNTNVQQGAATGNGFALPNLAPFNGAYSGGSTAATTTGLKNQNTDTGGTRFFDGTNDVSGFTIITQTFTLAATTNLSGSYALGVRDSGGSQAGTAANFATASTSRIDIFNTTTGVTVLTSYGDTTATGGALSANPGWEVNSFVANNVAAGDYTFRITLAGAQNIDAVNLVPEPSSWALLCLGGVVAGIVALRLRQQTA